MVHLKYESLIDLQNDTPGYPRFPWEPSLQMRQEMADQNMAPHADIPRMSNSTAYRR